MTVHDAQPQDIYVDENGKLWRCYMTCGEPTVGFEEVEGYVPNPMANQGAQAIAFIPNQMGPQIIRNRKNGSVGGAMWNGWKRIWRKDVT